VWRAGVWGDSRTTTGKKKGHGRPNYRAGSRAQACPIIRPGVLRTQENLRRRGLKPSETARAIRRLYELHGIVQGRHTPATPTPSSTVAVEEPPTKTAADIARDAGMGLTQAKMYNRLADLIPLSCSFLTHARLPRRWPTALPNGHRLSKRTSRRRGPPGRGTVDHGKPTGPQEPPG